jgi:hypothetical protein
MKIRLGQKTLILSRSTRLTTEPDYGLLGTWDPLARVEMLNTHNLIIGT